MTRSCNYVVINANMIFVRLDALWSSTNLTSTLGIPKIKWKSPMEYLESCSCNEWMVRQFTTHHLNQVTSRINQHCRLFHVPSCSLLRNIILILEYNDNYWFDKMVFGYKIPLRLKCSKIRDQKMKPSNRNFNKCKTKLGLSHLNWDFWVWII